MTTDFRVEKPLSLVQLEENIRHCGRVKKYPNGRVEILVCNRPVFREDGWDSVTPKKKRRPSEDADQMDIDGWLTGDDPALANIRRAQRRARSRVRDLALCCPFRYFVTLTLDPAKIDRYDINAITKRLNVWLDNRVRRKGLSYVLVPEHHKDGAIHFHGFFNDALRAVDSGLRDKGGHPIFNLPEWDFGFTTAIELYGDYDAAVSYVCKYIGKEMSADALPEKIGGRWYYSGGVLQRPEVELFDCCAEDYEGREDAFTFEIPQAGLKFTRIMTKLEENVE